MELGLKSGFSAGFRNAFLIRRSARAWLLSQDQSSCISSWDIKFGFGLFSASHSSWTCAIIRAPLPYSGCCGWCCCWTAHKFRNNHHCYMARKFSPTARAFIGYFEVTWHLTMRQFPAKISERATLQNLGRQRVTVHHYPRMSIFINLYTESFSSPAIYETNHLKAGPSGNSYFYFMHWDSWSRKTNINYFPRDQSLSV